MRLAPRIVVVVVYEIELLASDQVHDLSDDPLAAGIGVPPGELHQSVVVVAQRGVEPEDHLGLGYPVAPLGALSEREEGGSNGVSEAATAKVDADPDPVRLVGEHVHVVIAASHGSELSASLPEQVFPVLCGNRLPCFIIEQRMIYGGVVSLVGPADPEAHRTVDLVGDLVQPCLELRALGSEGRQVKIGPDGCVSARDIEPDTDHRDLVPVGGHATDRHHVTQVAVRHQGGALGALRDVAELDQRLFVVFSEYPHRILLLPRAPAVPRFAIPPTGLQGASLERASRTA